jgi:[ribosomal protein S5]-alanine N-acetyltransferase
VLGILFGGMPSVRLDGPAVYIRPPQMHDRRQWVELRRASRDFLVPWEPTWPEDGASAAAFRRRYRRFSDDWNSRTGFAFFIFEQRTDALTGGITLSNVRRGVAQSGTLGYWMGQPFTRRGYMFQAVGLVLLFAFETLGLHRVEAACMPPNEASRGLLRKLGFREEGIARQYLCINGLWQDHVTHAILRTDPRPAIASKQAALEMSGMSGIAG